MDTAMKHSGTINRKPLLIMCHDAEFVACYGCDSTIGVRHKIKNSRVCFDCLVESWTFGDEGYE